MRIVVTNHHSDRHGGVETYVERLLALLVEDGHDVRVAFDVKTHPEWPHIAIPEGVRSHIVETDGLEEVVREINAFEDSVVLSNSLDSRLFPASRLIDRPVAFFTHVYVGSCINQMRINRRPDFRPCDKPFGLSCLASYFPRQCGGRSPLTMLRSYRREEGHRRQLIDMDLVIANSDAVAEQLRAGGIAVETLHPFIDESPGAAREGWRSEDRRAVAFVGRFEDYKGGDALLSALPIVVQSLNVPVHLTMAGEGSQLETWREQARQLIASDSRISIDFPGWLTDEGIRQVYEESDVIVVPSVWPEPFGLVGLEAARFGLPAVAFAVGGIPEWLVDGLNGHLADGDRCRPEDLATALVRGLSDAGHYAELSAGAVRSRSKFSARDHLRRLTHILESIREQ